MGDLPRNHDELTLEMVTDEERDYMYAEYAQRSAGCARTSGSAGGWPRSSSNDRRVAELLHGCCSRSRESVLYYGDEI